MRPIVIAAAIVAATAGGAIADISWKTDRIAPGSALVLKSSDGGVFTHLRREASAGQARFDTYAGKPSKASYVGTYFTNPRGEVTRTVSADGEVTEFSPHRCMRTVGECRFTVTYSDGYSEKRVRVTQPTRDGLEYKVYGEYGLMSSGALSLDDMGSSRKGWTRDHATGKTTRIRQLSAVYR